jgi:hypothetical protein
MSCECVDQRPDTSGDLESQRLRAVALNVHTW